MTTMKRKVAEDSLEQYVSNANEVIKFRFVLSKEELDNEENFFNAEYTHQIFGESENIFGYIGLEVNCFYSACRLTPCFSMKYRERVKPSNTGGVEADDVYKTICDKIDEELPTDFDAFIESLKDESSFRPVGEIVSSFTIQREEEEDSFNIYRANITVPGLKEYHGRIQSLIMWFIDAASYIDSDDDRWDYFMLHQIVEVDGQVYYPFIGFAVVYRYYVYPNNIRPRISQMLVLPPYQKMGLGSKFLHTICSSYWKNPEVVDITVEDPSDDFVRIREFVDCKNCSRLVSFSPENLRKGFGVDMIEEAKLAFKINKLQARKVYEILRMKHTDLQDGESYKDFRIDVKRRLNIPYQKEKQDFAKLSKHLTPEELNNIVHPIPTDQRMDQLNQMYSDLEKRYSGIVQRLSLDD